MADSVVTVFLIEKRYFLGVSIKKIDYFIEAYFGELRPRA